MRILELFCGTKSIGKIAEARGHEVISVDFDKKFNPDILIDVLDIPLNDIDSFFGEKFDVVWASPPCTEYSKAKSQGKRDINYANKIVKHTIEIIRKLNPKIWVIENPQTGLLKNQEFMKEFPYVDISYCKYGLPYRKQTRLWTNLKFKGKTCNKDCDFMVDGLRGKRHIGSAGCGGKGQGHKIAYSNRSYKKIEKYALPEKLCLELIKCIENTLFKTKALSLRQSEKQ